MSEVDRDILRKFLNLNDCQNTESVIQILIPFYQIAEKGVFELVAFEEINEIGLNRAIEIFTETKIQKLIFISLGNPFPKPEWMSEEVYRKTLNVTIDDISGKMLDKFMNEDFEKSYIPDLFDHIFDSFGRKFFKALTVCIRKYCLQHSFAEYKIYENYRCYLRCLAGYALKNMPETYKFASLLQYFTKCFILGEKKNEPGVWLVLVK